MTAICHFLCPALTTPQIPNYSHLKNVIFYPYWRLDFQLSFDSRGTLLMFLDG